MIDERETYWLLKRETQKDQTKIKTILTIIKTTTRTITKKITGSYFS